MEKDDTNMKMVTIFKEIILRTKKEERGNIIFMKEE